MTNVEDREREGGGPHVTRNGCIFHEILFALIHFINLNCILVKYLSLNLNVFFMYDYIKEKA